MSRPLYVLFFMITVLSMKSALSRLTPNDRESLALFYDKADFKLLSKLITQQKSLLAEAHVGVLDITQVRYLTGQVAALNWLQITIRDNFKELNKQN